MNFELNNPEHIKACEVTNLARIEDNDVITYYHMSSHFKLNIETGITTVYSRVIRNWFSFKPEYIFEGSPQECINYVNNIVSTIEKM